MGRKNTEKVETVEKVRGGKSGQTRERRSFWNRALQAPKIREALGTLGVSEKKFEEAYLNTRKTRESAPTTPEHVAALKAYMTHRNMDTLRAALGKDGEPVSALTASVKLGRAIENGSI